jgi:AcrR family transcriptional regulator
LPSAVQQKTVGLRERNKLDKLRRIKDAASEFFILKGFDDATTREIALRAGVGLGTIFVYAANKRDLLFLIINDDLQAVVDKAATLVRPERAMLDNLLAVFKEHYRYFGRQPALSRLALREMNFYAGGPEARNFLKTRERLIALINDVVDMAITRKALATREDSSLIAWVIFSVYQIEVRHWLSSNELHLARGLDNLRRQLVLLMNGLSPRETL